MLEEKLEEMRKKGWEDPMMVTECVWVRGASQAAGKRSRVVCCCSASATRGGFGALGTAGPQERPC